METNFTEGGGILRLLARPCVRAGKLPNCHLNYTTVKADPDIAGIGVLLSFVVTCCISSMLVILSFFLLFPDSMNDNVFDRFVVRLLRIKIAAEPGARNYYSKIILPLILTLADQQVVTGLAVMIAGLIKCDVSVYHFNIIAELGLLASLTHMNSIVVIRTFTSERCAARIWRCAGLLLIGCLLLLVSFIQANEHWSDSDAWPMECLNVLGTIKTPWPQQLIFCIVVLVVRYGYMTFSLIPRVRRWTRNVLRPIKHQTDCLGVMICSLMPPAKTGLKTLSFIGRIVSDLFSSYILTALHTISWLVWDILWLYLQRIRGHKIMSSEQVLLESQWGFGQLIPMFLILLCFIPALETWSG